MQKRCPLDICRVAKISSTSSIALGDGREDATRGRTTITNASRRACTRLYTGERVHTRARGTAAFLPPVIIRGPVVGHRTRGRSKINGRGGYARSLLAARQCWRTDATSTVDRGSQTALRRMHSAALAVHPATTKTARPPAHARPRASWGSTYLMPPMSTTYSDLEIQRRERLLIVFFFLNSNARNNLQVCRKWVWSFFIK